MARTAAIIGAGPAGLMAAERLAEAGLAVTVFDRMPSVARKFLLAGRGGLNLTHSEPLPQFLARYGAESEWVKRHVDGFKPADLISWAQGLGQEVFTGSSGRIFPKSLKASPLLRAWLRRLNGLGVQFRLNHRWTGFASAGALTFDGETPRFSADVTVLALGGASWPRMGSDGAWAEILKTASVAVEALAPANCGVTLAWPDEFKSRHAGSPLKRITGEACGVQAVGEAMVTQSGLEGGLIYALSRPIREGLARGPVLLTLDLRPDVEMEKLMVRFATARKGESKTNMLRKAGLSPAAIGLLRHYSTANDALGLARAVKALALPVTGIAGLERAISTAGGVNLDAVDENLMLRAMPGVFAAGEMLAWEAPTGGYL
ncbi:MAG: TIGR03862 family flavoprotein, partial [Aestuariivirgaceae bacterium]|nr:TIGR03862 family flavoprotein [Aestuariivirgaceae bacterium]